MAEWVAEMETAPHEIGGKMSNLNSVLIEGVLTKEPVIQEISKNAEKCILTIVSKRSSKKDLDTTLQDHTRLDIVVYDRLFSRSCMKRGKKGSGVRVVGRLKESFGMCECGREHPTFVIVADHVEFRSIANLAKRT